MQEGIRESDMSRSRDLNDSGVELFLTGEIDGAIEQYQAALREEADNATAHNNLGLALAANGQHEQALDAYNQALLHNPQSRSANLNRGLSLLMLDRLQEAVDDFQAAIEIDEENPRPWEGLGEACRRAGMFESAADAWQVAFGLDPNNTVSAQQFAIALCDVERLDEALAVLERAVELRPEDASSHAFMGRVLLRRKDYGFADRVLRHALSIDPNNVEVRYDLAVTHLGKGETEEAMCEMELITRLEPGNEKANVDLAVLRLSMREYDDAEQRFRQVLAMNSENAKARYYLALTYTESGRPGAAMEHLAMLTAEDNLFAEKAAELLQALPGAD